MTCRRWVLERTLLTPAQDAGAWDAGREVSGARDIDRPAGYGPAALRSERRRSGTPRKLRVRPLRFC